MTRHRLNRTLRRTYTALGTVLALTLVAKLAPHIPGLAGTPLEALAKDVYDYAKDMALVFITVVAAYLASAFQRRATFVESLERQWRDIVHAKAVIVAYFEKPYPSTDDWLAATTKLSEAIDTMRIIYRNAGETRVLVGLYPYAPLHDMRRVLDAVDPRARNSIPDAERKLSRDCIVQSFNALRETFLEELDLEQPHHPVLISGARRTRAPGHTELAETRQRQQREGLAKTASPQPEIDAYLGRLYAREKDREPSIAATLATAKPSPKTATNGLQVPNSPSPSTEPLASRPAKP
ncbi:MAG: hypothetical protein K2Y05_11575 [Hyphomicrobiaceae bacterium]|nr:hypothetical protein [Hyphomicrobiaceae bacterium]